MLTCALKANKIEGPVIAETELGSIFAHVFFPRLKIIVLYFHVFVDMSSLYPSPPKELFKVMLTVMIERART